MKLVFTKLNTVLLVLAILVTIAGYMVMGTGENTISPILLIIAYAILFPAAILAGINKHDTEEEEQQ